MQVCRSRLAREIAVLPSPLEIPRDSISIAVLPFTNMSGDPEQPCFRDGLTEDIIGRQAKVLRTGR